MQRARSRSPVRPCPFHKNIQFSRRLHISQEVLLVIVYGFFFLFKSLWHLGIVYSGLPKNRNGMLLSNLHVCPTLSYLNELHSLTKPAFAAPLFTPRIWTQF